MKNIYIIFLSALCLLGTSCTKEEILGENGETKNNGIVVLQERNPNLPQTIETRPVRVEEKRTTRSTGENGEIIGNSDELLGYSYTEGNSILGDFNNVMYPVVDIDKVKEYGKDYITARSLQNYVSERFSYSDYETYESKMKETRKVSSGFQLNLGLFKIGRKKKTEETFMSELTTSDRVVYGELNLLLQNSSFSLQLVGGAHKFYARECLSSVFLRNLYSSTLGDILEKYGDFALTSYVTGGKACALYAGMSKKGNSKTSREQNMDKSMGASFSWNKDSVKGDFSFGRGNYNADSMGFEKERMYTKLFVYGGTPVGIAMNSADKLENLSFDLTPWVSSLSDSRKHTIVDVGENGLCPLSTFVLEENFKKRLDNTSLGIIDGYRSLAVPHIEIMRVFDRYSSSGDALYDVVPVLFTRQRDRIVLRSGKTATETELRSYENATVFDKKALEIKNQKQAFYELRISANSITRLNPQMSNPLCVDLPMVDEGSMYVFTNPRTGIQYIYDIKNKIAFSHYTDELDGDWILDDYGIRSWVESLPVRNISMATLANSYRIIGL